MKVIAINGSPKKNGNTSQSLQLIGNVLTSYGVAYEIIHVGGKNIYGCTACGECAKTLDEKCTINTDDVNEWIQELKHADGFIISSPVYYAGIAGTMKCFLDRAFYVAGVNNALFRHKVGASVVAVRRSGGSATFDSLNHYLNSAEILMPSSNYWTVIHGRTPGEIEDDIEGKQALTVLAENMVWLLKMKAETNVTEPLKVDKIFTSFVR